MIAGHPYLWSICPGMINRQYEENHNRIISIRAGVTFTSIPYLTPQLQMGAHILRDRGLLLAQRTSQWLRLATETLNFSNGVPQPQGGQVLQRQLMVNITQDMIHTQPHLPQHMVVILLTSPASNLVPNDPAFSLRVALRKRRYLPRPRKHLLRHPTTRAVTRIA
jgi:hypothetical protein